MRRGGPRQQAKCFICKRPDCRSWKHPEHEQKKSRAEFTAANRHKYPHAANFAETLEQFIADFEGDESNEDDIGFAFESFISGSKSENEEHLSSFGDLALTSSREEASSSGGDSHSRQSTGGGGFTAPPELGASVGSNYTYEVCQFNN
jgi:hypothetical protein